MLTAPATVRLQNISKRYNAGDPPLLDRVNLTVAEAESVAIMGPSGSGKSTLIHIIGGLVRPDSGALVLNGIEVSDTTDWNDVRARMLGFVFQDCWLLPGLTAGENVELP